MLKKLLIFSVWYRTPCLLLITMGRPAYYAVTHSFVLGFELKLNWSKDESVVSVLGAPMRMGVLLVSYLESWRRMSGFTALTSLTILPLDFIVRNSYMLCYV